MKKNDERLLGLLFEISGKRDRIPSQVDYEVVFGALDHPDEEIRERAIFIGGLRWMDDAVLERFKQVLMSGEESCEDNRRLMVESLISQAIERGKERAQLTDFLLDLLDSMDADSLGAKAAFIGIMRLRNKVSKQQFAALDYDNVMVDRSKL